MALPRWDLTMVGVSGHIEGLQLVVEDDALVDVLRRHRQRVEVYLQYDGADAAASTQQRS